eukprot:TRINITY_DN19861_c0_g1_i1.p1 TRINITY_DN19861_c0_g1~~TRINITY_DN19861_c0_g1_i1.p1  ORF type:complete len:325 (+),score=16.51 TRINITY_DN19861_c0_g1_i1:105-977(+)
MVVAVFASFVTFSLRFVHKEWREDTDWEIVACCNARFRRYSANTALFVFRAAAAVYIIGSLIYWVSTSGPRFMYWFTVWTWALLGIYFVAAAVSSVLHCTSSNAQCGYANSGNVTTLSVVERHAAHETRGYKRFARVNQLLFSTVAASALMLDIVLWAILFPNDTSPGHKAMLNVSSYNMHAFNLVLVMTELGASSMTVRPSDLFIAVLWPMTYTMFTIIRVAASSQTRPCLTNPGDNLEACAMAWPYFFMNTSIAVAPLWYLAILVLYTLAFGAVHILARYLRSNATSR